MAHFLPETRLLHSLLRLHGRCAGGFTATVLADGCVCITGPHTAAFYPGLAWTSRFLGHLCHGYFDPAPVAERRAFA